MVSSVGPNSSDDDDDDDDDDDEPKNEVVDNLPRYGGKAVRREKDPSKRTLDSRTLRA